MFFQTLDTFKLFLNLFWSLQKPIFPKEVGKNEKSLKKKKVSVSEKKISAPNPIPKLDLGFGSRYRNLVSVAHHTTDMATTPKYEWSTQACQNWPRTVAIFHIFWFTSYSYTTWLTFFIFFRLSYCQFFTYWRNWMENPITVIAPL